MTSPIQTKTRDLRSIPVGRPVRRRSAVSKLAAAVVLLVFGLQVALMLTIRHLAQSPLPSAPLPEGNVDDPDPVIEPKDPANGDSDFQLLAPVE
ncbi:MAG: hypothetical protein U1E27_06675 [Kiritimatiellia bacterium]|nr:hypothetical protein [Kiritimatiellia bacterium]